MKENYFQHDYNPTNDPKIVCLLGNYGGMGYGVFWRIIELLHQEKEHKLPIKPYIYEAIAKQMLTDAKQVQTIIDDCFKFELLEHDKGHFWSNRVLTNIEKRQEISEKRSFAGRAGAIAKQNLANTSKVKESKVKESKVNTNIEREEKPHSHTKEFFNNTTEQNRIKEELTLKGYEENVVKNELVKFISYWTEPNRSGTKQRWELEKTFEISRRLATWFLRINNFKNNKVIQSI